MYPCLPQCSTERSELSPILAKPRSNVTVRDGFITAIGTGVTRCGVDFLGQVLGVALLLVVHRQGALQLGQLQSNVDLLWMFLKTTYCCNILLDYGTRLN